jgi:uncharacterized protein
MIKFIFPVIFLFVFALMLFYAKKRLIDKTTFKDSTKRIFYILIAIIYFFVILYFINRFYTFLPQPLYYLSTLSQGIGFIIFVFTLFFEFYLLITRFVTLSQTKKQIIEISLFVVMIFYIGFGIINGHKKIEITQHNLTSTKTLPQNLNIVFLSDLHIGGLVDSEHVTDMIDKINSTNADVVLIGGDLIDTKIELIQDELELLKNIKSKFGVYFIVGNHEYFHDLEHIIETSKTLGLIPLLNDTVHIKELDVQISGIYDYIGKRRDMFSPDLNALNIDKDLYSILVSHQPKVTEDLDFDSTNFDLILSGHTHCGQIAPFGFLVLIDQPYLCGEYDISDNTKLIISAGVGFWGPKMRIGSNYEIHQITIANYD